MYLNNGYVDTDKYFVNVVGPKHSYFNFKLCKIAFIDIIKH
jgi:hypothetical protein